MTPAARYGGRPPLYAGWGRRVAASLVDLLVLVVGAVPMLVGAQLWRHDAVAGRTTRTDAFGQTLTTDGDPSGLALTVTLVGALVYLVVWFWNRCLRQGRTGRSLGKSVFGLLLVDDRRGLPVGSGVAFLRELAHNIDSLVCYLGWLWPLWDSRYQTLADKLCSTVVVVQRADAAA